MPELNDLEATTLGVIWKTGPCTPYTVRKEFQNSRSSHWSGSSGTIYPLIRKLEKTGFLTSSNAKTGKRKSKLYTLTSKGLSELRKWLKPPLTETDVMLTLDLVRTRLFFLEALTPKQRELFFDDAERKLEKELKATRCLHKQLDHDIYKQLAALCGVKVLKARIQWIREARKALIR
jgi:DNA-binding PadR family transcriptional regulator